MVGLTNESSSSNKNELVDFDDPFYRHPYDYAVTTLVTIKLNGTGNY